MLQFQHVVFNKNLCLGKLKLYATFSDLFKYKNQQIYPAKPSCENCNCQVYQKIKLAFRSLLRQILMLLELHQKMVLIHNCFYSAFKTCFSYNRYKNVHSEYFDVSLNFLAHVRFEILQFLQKMV